MLKDVVVILSDRAALASKDSSSSLAKIVHQVVDKDEHEKEEDSDRESSASVAADDDLLDAKKISKCMTKYGRCEPQNVKRRSRPLPAKCKARRAWVERRRREERSREAESAGEARVT